MMSRRLFKLSTILLLMSAATVSYGINRSYRAYEGLSSPELNEKVWLFAGRAEVSGHGAELYSEGDIYWEKINRSGDFFIIKGDTVYWKGFNRGRRLGCLTENPVKIFTPGDGSTSTTDYKAKGTLDATFEITETGTIEWSELSRGSIVLSSTDTLKDVRLTRLVRTVMTEDEEGPVTDTLTSYRWYLSGVDIPVAIQSGGHLFVADADDPVVMTTKEKSADEGRIADILNKAVIDRDGTSVTIRLSEPLDVQAYIMDMPGNIYVSINTAEKTFRLDISGLLPNTYVITIIAVEAPECSRKIILTV